jgi:hypothetical protein
MRKEGFEMVERLCESCLNRDEDWFDKNGHITKIPFCAANRPQFPVAYECAQYEPKEPVDALAA